MRKTTIFIVVALLLTLCSAPVYASTPLLPHAFYGDVLINGRPAPAGTTVEAKGEGVITGIANPITVTETGKYGGPGGLDPKLVVQGDIADEATITFYVNGHSTGETYPFDSGEVTELPLSVTIVAPPPRPGPAPRIYVETILFGIEASFSISEEGEILETIEATSEDGMLTITIPEGTIALDKEGEPLSTLTAAVDPSPPEPPEGTYLMGAYDFGPYGATFDPWITFTWSYDPDEIPEDVAEEDLIIAYYDQVAGLWVELDCVVDTENNTITAYVEHFTTFAIIALAVPLPPPPPPPVAPAPAAFAVSSLTVHPAEVQPREAVTITVSVANTGGTEGTYTVVLKINEVKVAEKSVTIAAGDSQAVSFSVTKADAGSYSVVVDGLRGSFVVVAPPVVPPVIPPEEVPAPPVKPPINWPLVGGVIAGVVVVGLLIFFLVRRRRAY